jgi:DNA-binding NtrC family response regulator
MEYITSHKHTLRNEPFAMLNGIAVLLVEPEPETRSFYTNQLSNMDMRVVARDNIRAMSEDAQSDQFDVVIVNPSDDIKSGISFLKAFRKDFPDLPVITMTLTMPDDTLDAIMNAGVTLHINRGLTRPRDLLLALEQVISMK